MSRRQVAYIELAAAMVFVGSSFIAGRIVTERFPLALAVTLRFGLAALLLLPLLARGAGRPKLTRRDGATLGLQALTGVIGFNLFLLLGLRYTTASESGIIVGTTPAVIGLFAFLLLRERLGIHRLAGIVLAVCGVAAISVTGGDGAERGSNPLLGNVLIVGTVVCEALFFIFGKLVAGRLSSLVISTSVSVIGCLSFLPFALLDLQGFDPGAVGTTGWLALAYYATGATVVPYLLWYDGLAWVPAGIAGVFTAIMPVSTVVLAALVLDEPLRTAHAIGMICVLAAIGLTVRGERRPAGDSAALGDGGRDRPRLAGARHENLVVKLRQLKLGRDAVAVECGLPRR